MEVTTELLRRFPILKPLSDTTLRAIADQSTAKKYSRRGIVLTAGEREEHVCFLFEGRLQGVDFTIDGREVGLFFVEPGDICGELGLFDDGPQSEFVLALTAAVVVLVRKEVMRKIMANSPGLLSVLSSKLAARVRQMTFQRSLLGLPNIAQRVCCQLWTLIPGNERDLEQDREFSKSHVIENPPTHLEIAIMLSISRETVTRVFQSLQKRQIVRRDGMGKLVVLNLKELKELAEGDSDL